MGVIYSAFPVDECVRDWLADNGEPEPSADGRAPTAVELRTALDDLAGFDVTYRPTPKGWDAEIAFPAGAPDAGSTDLWVTEPDDADAPCRFAFHKGSGDVTVRVTYHLAERFGPFAFIVDSDGRPLLIDAARTLADVRRIWAERERASA